jgi:carbon starvation protein CstA
VVSLCAELPFWLIQRPTSYLSGPDSIVASIVTLIGVVLVGSQLVGPLTNRYEPILTSLAVQDGLPPTSSLIHAVFETCAAAIWAAKSKPTTSSTIVIPYRTTSVRYRLVQQHLSFLSLVLMV